MSAARIEHLLERTMGLHAASIGVSAIRRAVEVRARACDVDKGEAYWTLVRRSREELQELIDAVVVPETWFFRDPQAFAALAAMAGDLAATRRGSGALRLLSLPCSTGEEPYTMAMALLDAGVPPDGFHIDAVDISARALMRARFGVYGRNSFRGKDLSFRDRHFTAVAEGLRVADAVRTPVRFSIGNILEPDFLAGAEAYDFVFCRNLLIYFNTETQSRAIAVLKRLLAPEGVLFVGHSEAGLMPAEDFVSARIPMAFAFRPVSRSQSATAGVACPAEPPSRPRRARAGSAVPWRPEAPARHERKLASPSLDELRRIADAGRFEEAERGCETILRERGPSADVLLLMALISDARGEAPAASERYRKVLYLEPGNRDALGHLALLLRRQGDEAGASRLDARMQRLDERRAG